MIIRVENGKQNQSTHDQKATATSGFRAGFLRFCLSFVTAEHHAQGYQNDERDNSAVDEHEVKHDLSLLSVGEKVNFNNRKTPVNVREFFCDKVTALRTR